MNKENTKRLLRAFPVLYQDYYSPATQTCMCWGFSCGDGWFDIIWNLSKAINSEMGYDNAFLSFWLLFKKRLSVHWNRLARLGPKKLVWFPFTGLAVDQVKEKFGTLRFYCSVYYIGDLERRCRVRFFIGEAERLSGNTCEACGKFGRLGQRNGWYSTLCPACAEEGWRPDEN